MKKVKKVKGKGQKGFTLIELLVVVGILAALAAILVPNVARFVGTGREEGAEAEKDSVQSAMDAAIADLGLPGVIDRTGQDITEFGLTGAAPIVTNFDPDGAGPLLPRDVYLFPDYLRFENAHYGPYEWNDTGLVFSDAVP